MYHNNTSHTPVLSVAMRAYNQEKEIVRALDSVIMQHIQYEVELVIGVDKSSDNTLAVVEEYCTRLPEKFSYKIITHETNVGGAENWVSVMNLCSGIYIAILDGDDYWIDSEKCNKQIDILDKSPDIGLVYADCYLENEQGIRFYSQSPNALLDSFSQMLLGNICISSTVMFRSDICIDYQPLLLNRWKSDDYYTWLEIAAHFRFFHLPCPVAVYTRTYGQRASLCFEDNVGADRDMRQCVDLCNFYMLKYPQKTSVTYSDLLKGYHKEVVKTGIAWKNFDYIQESVLELLHMDISVRDKIYLYCLRYKISFQIYLIYRELKKMIR